MKCFEVLSCSFDSWYEVFKQYSIKSYVLDLPSEIVEYLKNSPLMTPASYQHYKVDKRNSSDDSSESSWSDEEDSDVESAPPAFPEFEEKVNKVIEQFDGEVFCKLNWSAPKDAQWINRNHSLKCTSASDVFILLKASDFISYDLHSPFALCSDEENSYYSPKLVLRAWRSIRPETEFRCFVKSNSLIAISQRNCDSYYDFIETEKNYIEGVIVKFFESNIKGKFPLENYTLDVFVSHQFTSPKCVRLVDFNVFGLPTDGLMFDWRELNEITTVDGVVFRWQKDRALKSNTMSQYKLPIDLVDISSGQDPEKLIDLIQEYVEKQEKDEKP